MKNSRKALHIARNIAALGACGQHGKGYVAHQVSELVTKVIFHKKCGHVISKFHVFHKSGTVIPLTVEGVA